MDRLVRRIQLVALVLALATSGFAVATVKADPNGCCGTIQNGDCVLDAVLWTSCSTGSGGNARCVSVNPNFPTCCTVPGGCGGGIED